MTTSEKDVTIEAQIDLIRSTKNGPYWRAVLRSLERLQKLEKDHRDLRLAANVMDDEP